MASVLGVRTGRGVRWSNRELRRVVGDGVVYGQLDCLGVKLDDGAAIPISYWPPGYSARRTPGVTRNGALLDASGNTVLREGDRVSVRLSAVQQMEEFQRASSRRPGDSRARAWALPGASARCSPRAPTNVT